MIISELKRKSNTIRFEIIRKEERAKGTMICNRKNKLQISMSRKWWEVKSRREKLRKRETYLKTDTVSLQYIIFEKLQFLNEVDDGSTETLSVKRYTKVKIISTICHKLWKGFPSATSCAKRIVGNSCKLWWFLQLSIIKYIQLTLFYEKVQSKGR